MELLSDDEAVALLKAACDRAGSIRAFANSIGMEASTISNMLHKNAPISNTVGYHIGVRRVHAYVPRRTNTDPKQERYTKQREEWAKQVVAQGYKSGTEGARRTGTFKRASPPEPIIDHTKAARERRIERLARKEAQAKADKA